MRRTTSRSSRLVPVMGLALVAALAAGPGCQTERIVTSHGRPLPPQPRPAPAVPAGAVPNRMILLWHMPEDSDGNGFADLIRVETALFAYPHPTALEAPGAFVFSLFPRGEARRSGAEPLAEWRFEGEAPPAARARALYGMCYRFELRLLDVGTDRLPAVQADLRGRFEPGDGGPPVLASDEVRLVPLGRRGQPAADEPTGASAGS